jgi:myo-inositol 2-dehydrogenase / D-chiro-inositol 1-dehydrogenase
MVFHLGLIGAGRMGRTHLRALADSSEVRISTVVEPVRATRESLDLPGIPIHATHEQMLSSDRPDGVLVVAPSTQHQQLVESLVAEGLPVLCEKPLGVRSTETRTAADAADAALVPLQVAYWRRYVPVLQELRDRILSGQFGSIHHVLSSQWDEAPPSAGFRQSSGGIFVDMGVHEFDQVRWLTGQDFVDITAVASPLDVIPEAGDDPDSAQALASMSGGALCSVSLGRYHPRGDMATIEVFGTKGTFRSQFLDPSEGDSVQIAALRAQAEAFATWVGGGPCTGATAHDAIAALQVAERATATMTAHRSSCEFLAS